MCVCVLLQVTQTELERLKSSYRQAVRDAAQVKRKFHEACKGGDSWYHSLLCHFHTDSTVWSFSCACIAQKVYFHHDIMCLFVPVLCVCVCLQIKSVTKLKSDI